ncbi:uncharacterized protein A1O5_05574 [Cladophialophora psammophila CBS 110553]|uniref:Major facilitator superfamily (MFS) profile domain-containing protein n=1 Tax=Cladophialophora psammophila CBS 110553 TaxID=1182543 RepID=W9XN35_9EURO|nr:uncharacterized protein A1O5_05574 [Cladophialophora psammophila CBS 110553]EXJ71764.1 hypothetical protein A1O5_05574 [Cladophialophora psammophila CBS 110553]
MANARTPFLRLEGHSLSWAITLCAGSAFLLFGYDQGVLGSIISGSDFLGALGISPDDPDTLSTVVSIYDIGNMVGCLAAAIWGGRYGRRAAITFGCIVTIIGAALQASSYSVAQIIVARIITGIGNGVNTAIVPTWVAETAKSEHRGKLIATQLTTAILGIVIAYWINYGFFHLHGQVVWRFPIAFQIVFVLFTLAGLPFLPESPRYLYFKDRVEEGNVVLSALKAQPIESPIVQAEAAEILAAIEMENSLGKASIKDILLNRSGDQILKRLILVVVIQVLQEMTGTQIVVYYSSSIFITLGIENGLALILGGIVSIAFLLGSILGVFLIDRIGRKKLLISGTVPMFVLYILYMIMVKNGGKAQLWVAFGATCAIMFAFGWSWLSTAWVYGPELVPVRYRHVGGALNAFSNWTFAFVTVKIAPIGIANLGWKFYIIFIVMTFIQLPVVWLFYPETKGLSLEEIDGLFVKNGEATEMLADASEKRHQLEIKDTGYAHEEVSPSP